MRRGLERKRFMKLRTLLLCFAAAIALTLCASAADIVDSGTCGENVTWTLDSDGVLNISGTGAMDDWGYNDKDFPNTPWKKRNSNIVTAVINKGVTSIGAYAFYECANLTSVTIPDSVTSMCDSVFAYCVSLTNVTIPDSVISIGDSAFSGCASLTSVTIPDSVSSIGGHAFASCGLTSVTIPDGVTSIGRGTFLWCNSLTSVTIGNSVTSIGSHAFYECKSLTGVTIPDSVTSIGNYAFHYCSRLTGVTIGNGVTSIGESAFSFCASLTSITIPDSVISIGVGAFRGCANLTSVIIPNSVTNIFGEAFRDCKSLKDVYYNGSAAQWKEINIFRENDALKNATIHYNEQDVGVGITLTDKNGDTVDATGHTGEREETKKDVFQDGAEFTASFTAADPDAVKSSELVTANVFLIFYDKGGLMVSLESREINLSDPLNLMFVLELRIPEGAKTLKFLILSDSFEPLRVARMIESSAA